MKKKREKEKRETNNAVKCFTTKKKKFFENLQQKMSQTNEQKKSAINELTMKYYILCDSLHKWMSEFMVRKIRIEGHENKLIDKVCLFICIWNALELIGWHKIPLSEWNDDNKEDSFFLKKIFLIWCIFQQ